MIGRFKEGSTDASAELAEYVANFRYEHLPLQVIEVTKLGILDVIGTTLAASGTAPGCRELVDLVTEGKGREESTIMAFGTRVPSWMAAFANGAMAHSIDYDDTVDEAGLHLSITTVPPAFAMAERVGKVTGREFITAVALGNDILCRLALAVTRSSRGYKFDWLLTPVLGVFSAAAVSGRLLRLGQDQLVDAFGIAFHQAAGTLELGYSVGSIIRGMYAGFVGKTGVLSALMAERGISGTKTSLEGKAGLYNVYFEDHDRDSLVGDLGKRFEAANVSFKPWPSCRGTHPYIDAALRILQDHHLQAEDLDHIRVFVGDVAKTLCEPIEARRKPQSSLDAKFSIPFSVGAAVVRRKLTIGDFTPDGIKAPAVLQMAERVTPELSPELTTSGVPPAIVEIVTKYGQSYSQRVDFAYGHPRNPIRTGDLLDKFRNCASYSVKPLPKKNIEEVIKMVGQLENVEDVADILELIS